MGVHTNLKREIVKAKVKNSCLLIVEGYEDISFYEKLLGRMAIEDTYTIIEIGKLRCGSGCTGIVDQFLQHQDYFNAHENILPFVRGIIDADVFCFCAAPEKVIERNSIKGLFTLRYYSYESHAITLHNIEQVFRKLTHCNQSCFTQKIKQFVYDDIELKVTRQMYYVGLDCLKNAKIDDYTSEFTYSDKEKSVGDYNRRKWRINNKIDIDNLNEFAKECGLSYCLENVKRIVKGKHLLYAYSNELKHLFGMLERFCKNDEFSDLQCGYEELCATKAEIGDSIPCCWKNEFGYNEEQIYNELLNQFDMREFIYFKENLRSTVIKFIP